MQTNETKFIEHLKAKPKQFAILGGVSLLFLIGIYFLYRKFKNDKDTKTFNSIDPSDSKGAMTRILANQLRAAFNPSGFSWMIGIDTTNKTEVLSVGGKMKANKIAFSDVAKMYNLAYKDDLNKRLQAELSNSELSKFYANAGLNGIFSEMKEKLFAPDNLIY